MRTTNNNGKVLRLSRYRLMKYARRSGFWMVAILAAVLFLGAFKFGWFGSLIPRDAGPEELTAHQRITSIEAVDFECYAAVTTVFPVSAYNPGWKAWVIQGGQAYVVFDVVGDLDVCVWAEDYTIGPSDDGSVIEVVVEEIKVNRPRLDYNPREINGVMYQTTKLSTHSHGLLADANIDRVWWEAARNTVTGSDHTYIDDHMSMLLVFAQNQLAESKCYRQAIEVMEAQIHQHYLTQAELFGFEGVEIQMPNLVSIPSVAEYFDPGKTVLKVEADETCHVNQT